MSVAGKLSTVAVRRCGLASVVLAACAVGCQSNGKMVASDPAPPATAVEHPLLRGIPVPEGFRLVPEHSTARNRGEVRDAKCEFEGRLAPAEVAKFYDHYLPLARFAPGPKMFNNGEYMLRYASDAEECNVWIKPTLFGTVLVVDVGPVSRGAGNEPNPAPRSPNPSANR